MFEKTGIASRDMVMGAFPSLERINRGPVAVVEWEALRPLFPELSICPADPAELFLRISALEGMAGRCRLLPCLTAAGTSLLAAFRSDGVLTDGAKSDIVFAAVTKTPLSPGGDYQALI